MTYVYWLLGISAAFVAFERLWPRRRQPLLRAALATDLLYLAFNGHFLGVLLALASEPLLARLDLGFLGGGAVAHWPMAAQLAVAFVAVDLLHWCIHNLLHRVPALWSLHKVHHSIVTMDFLGSLRFHFAEGIVYKTLTYPLLAFFGFGAEALFWLAVVSTAIGHFNHSNLRIRIGPLGYVFNNPAMHVWHHAHPDAGLALCNFGVNLAVWDFLFGTAYVSPEPPARLGFDGVERFPTTFPGQLVHPLPLERMVRGWLAGRRRQLDVPPRDVHHR